MSSRLTWAIGLVVTSVMLILYAMPPGPLQQLSGAVFDSYQRAAPRMTNPDAPVHVIDIDEASLDLLGQWPWPRTYLAEMSDRLFELGAVTVGFDILFTEPDRTSPGAVVENLSRFSEFNDPLAGVFGRFPDHDAVFAEALSRGPVVLAVAGAPRGVAPDPKAGIAFTGRRPDAALSWYPGALAPLPELQEQAAGIGAISLATGRDGITRSVPMVAIFGETMLPSFAAELLRVAQGAGGHILSTTEASGQFSGGTVRPVAMRTGALTFPVDGNGHFRIHFAERLPDRVTSAADLLSNEVNTELLRSRIDGKIILVGSSAQSLFDIRATPLDSEVPGVFLHADIIEQIISGTYLLRPDWAPGLEIVLILCVGIIVTTLASRDRPVLGLAAVVLSVGGTIVLAWAAFFSRGTLFDPVIPALTGLAVYLPATTVSVFGKERQRRMIRDQFGHFLPEVVVKQISDNPEHALAPTGAELDLTVMFVDMRGFTSATETMSPDDVVRLLNIYLGAVSEALVETGATIDKYIGDAVMAFWNAPLPVEDHAGRAIRAIFLVEAAVEKANKLLRAKGLPEVQTRIGINTGPAFVGLMGSSERYNYSCVGDSVTLAARLEQMTRTYGVSNLVGEDAAVATPQGYLPIPLDDLQVRGRIEREIASTIVKDTADAHRLAEAVRRVHSAYRTGDPATLMQACGVLESVTCEGVDTKILAHHYRSQINDMPSDAPPMPRLARRR